MTFLHDDFLLSTDTAKRLYHEHAAAMPIYDYHCHLPPQDLASNRCFNNLAEVWLEGDHYKWRAMRANGVDEAYITGEAEPYDKFLAWARTVPQTLRNPLYHWTHLELKRYFGIDALLNADTAQEVWDEAAKQLKAMPVSAILEKFNVALICTTDDPADDLAHHAQIVRDDTFKDTAIYPAFRPDRLCAVDDRMGFYPYVDSLADECGIKCKVLDDLLEVIRRRHAHFRAHGCRLSDHGLTYIPTTFFGDPKSLRERAAVIFEKRIERRAVSYKDRDAFLMFMLLYLGALDAEHGWVQQFHLGAMRNNNPWALEELGTDTGYDSIGDYPQAEGLSWYLGTLAARDQLPKTILYNLNPSDNYLFASMIGNFQGVRAGRVCEPGRIQFGSGWWFLDQDEAMRWQINALSNIGLLSRFIGMLTDSRSFMSYPRHEYFRRVLCDLLGADVEAGRIPNDQDLIGGLVEDICFHNAWRYFGMRLKGRHAD